MTTDAMPDLLEDGRRPLDWLRPRSPLAHLVAQGALPNVEKVDENQPVASTHPDALSATQELLDRVEATLTPTATGRPEWHSAIPMRLEQFYTGMLLARHVLGPGAHRFLDVGSGIGTKVALARALGWDAVGLENHDPYADVSDRLFPHCRVVRGDATAFDGYGDFDLVYAYKPAVQNKVQDQINRRISDQLKPGSLFFSASNSGPYPEWLEHVGWLVWRKGDD